MKALEVIVCWWFDLLRVVNLSQNAVLEKKSQNHASCKNFQIDQSAHSIFDYPKMPLFSKKQI